MRNVKKNNFFVILIFTVLFTFLMSSFAFAAPAPTDKEQTVVINEYQVFKDLKSKSDNELKAMGYSDNKIKEIKNFDYAAKIREMNSLDDQTLKNKGYSNEKIQKIRNFKGTETEMITLAASCTVSMSLNAHYKSSTYSYATIGFSWSWDSEPFFGYTDIIAVAYTQGFGTASSPRYATITYRHATNPSDTYTESATCNPQVGGVSWKVPMKVVIDKTNYYWAKSGSGSVKIYKDGYATNCEVRTAYGHTTAAIIPSVSFPGGVSITFGSYTSEEDSIYQNYTL